MQFKQQLKTFPLVRLKPRCTVTVCLSAPLTYLLTYLIRPGHFRDESLQATDCTGIHNQTHNDQYLKTTSGIEQIQFLPEKN